MSRCTRLFQPENSVLNYSTRRILFWPQRSSKTDIRRKKRRKVVSAAFSSLLSASSRNLYNDSHRSLRIFSPFFSIYNREKLLKYLDNRERERETKREFDRCFLKSFFKGNEKTKDLFPRVIRVSKNMGEKKNCECEKFQRQLRCFVVVCFDFSWKIGREARIVSRCLKYHC